MELRLGVFANWVSAISLIVSVVRARVRVGVRVRVRVGARVRVRVRVRVGACLKPGDCFQH